MHFNGRADDFATQGIGLFEQNVHALISVEQKETKETKQTIETEQAKWDCNPRHRCEVALSEEDSCPFALQAPPFTAGRCGANHRFSLSPVYGALQLWL
jgi:hypothetical protein